MANQLNTNALKRKRFEDDFDIYSTEPKRQRKATGRSNPQPRRRQARGSLYLLPQMPLDIIYEVLSHMGPRELLMLSRTTKAFRDLLVRPSSASFWRDARRNIQGFPERPSWLHEIAYAKLAFDTLCTGCSKKRVYHVEWDLLARLCPQCKMNMTRPYGVSDVYHILQGLPWSACDGLINSSRAAGKPHIRRILDSEMQELKDAWNGTGADKSPDLQEAFVRARTQYVRERSEFALEASQWETSHKEKCRLDSILQKFKDSGWTEELEVLTPPILQKFLPSSRGSAYCPRTWSKLEGELRKLLERTRVERLYAQRYTIMCSVVDEFRRAQRGVFPSYPEFAYDPQVNSILTDTTANNLSHSDFRSTIAPQILSIRNRWESQIRMSIATRILSQTRCKYIQDPVDLAIGALMRCSSCELILESPGLLAHQCSSKHESLPPYLSSLTFLAAFRHAIWDYKFTEILRLVIAAYGADPASTRAEDMDASPTRLFCAHCARRMPGVMVVLSWREAVAHCYTTHKDEKLDFTLEGITWGRVPRDQCLDARPLEETVAVQLTEKCDANRQWLCGLCSAWSIESKHATEAHVRSEHPSYCLIGDSFCEYAVQDCIYRSPDAGAIISGKGVYLVTEELSREDIPTKLSAYDANELLQAFDEGMALFSAIPESYLGINASGTSLSMYFDDLHSRSLAGIKAILPTMFPFPFSFPPIQFSHQHALSFSKLCPAFGHSALEQPDL